MNYELAKQLKDAGYEQKNSCTVCPHNLLGNFPIYLNDILHYCYEAEELCYTPTLSELIEACGDEFFALSRLKEDWTVTKERFYSNGSTPEEAVAKLWLALNKK